MQEPREASDILNVSTAYGNVQNARSSKSTIQTSDMRCIDCKAVLKDSKLMIDKKVGDDTRDQSCQYSDEIGSSKFSVPGLNFFPDDNEPQIRLRCAKSYINNRAKQLNSRRSYSFETTRGFGDQKSYECDGEKPFDKELQNENTLRNVTSNKSAEIWSSELKLTHTHPIKKSANICFLCKQEMIRNGDIRSQNIAFGKKCQNPSKSNIKIYNHTPMLIIRNRCSRCLLKKCQNDSGPTEYEMEECIPKCCDVLRQKSRKAFEFSVNPPEKKLKHRGVQTSESEKAIESQFNSLAELIQAFKKHNSGNELGKYNSKTDRRNSIRKFPKQYSESGAEFPSDLSTHESSTENSRPEQARLYSSKKTKPKSHQNWKEHEFLDEKRYSENRRRLSFDKIRANVHETIEWGSYSPQRRQFILEKKTRKKRPLDVTDEDGSTGTDDSFMEKPSRRIFGRERFFPSHSAHLLSQQLRFQRENESENLKYVGPEALLRGIYDEFFEIGQYLSLEKERKENRPGRSRYHNTNERNRGEIYRNFYESKDCPILNDYMNYQSQEEYLNRKQLRNTIVNNLQQMQKITGMSS